MIGEMNKNNNRNNRGAQSRKFQTFILVACALIFIAILGFIDYVTGPYLSFQIFYLIPVSLVAWFGGVIPSVPLLIASIIAWFYDDVAGSHSYTHPLIPYWNIFVKIVFFFFVVYLVTKLRQIFDREKLFARMDYLTGTANKRYFYETAIKEINRSNRYRRSVTLAYVDLDDFKRINDLFGHASGDDALRLTAETLKKSVRGTDTIARMGGDEFAILLPETDYEAAKVVIQRIQNEFSRSVNNKTYSTTLSIGVITCANRACNLESLVMTADSLMYSVKKEGKNAVKYEILK